MKLFISSAVFALTILTATASFAQSPSPAESNEATPASTASDTHLYESVGFRHVPPASLPPNPYTRANVFMQMPL
jgi:putative acetyltransferase